jgi:hypothetical protein
MREEGSLERRQLMAPYRRPFRHVLALSWRQFPQMRRAVVLAGVFWLAAAAGAVAAWPPVLGLGVLGGITASISAFPWLNGALHTTLRMRRAWRQKTELGTVRRKRPQAGSEDPDYAHDEFAVTVEDEGYLVTWRFRPLVIGDEPTELEIVVPGRPQYAASPVDQRTFDAVDAARAAEQLVEAQTRAADREQAAAEAANSAHADAERRAELAEEARSTAAALQRSTGQRSRRD